MNMKNSSIKSKLTKYFIFFTLIILSIVWIMQIIFITVYYQHMLENEIIEISKIIEQNDKIYTLNEIAFKNSLNIVIFDKNDEVKYSSTNSSAPFAVKKEDVINALNKSDKYYTTYTVDIKEANSRGLVYVSYVDDYYYVITANIDPISSVTNIQASQLVYITLLIMLVAIGLSLYISNRLIKPINKITKQAKKLGKGELDINFEKSEYDEINTLSDTLNYSAKELKKTDTLRKELIANVSHDIKTPITIIKAYSEMIKDISGDNKEKREEHLDVIINQTDLLTRLIGDMMDLSKLETTVYELKKEHFDITEEIKNIVTGFEYLKDYNFEFQNDLSNENSTVLADKLKINQVLYNLISNAVNYVGEDKKIIIKTTYNPNIDKVKVEVIDHGKGIEDTTHIFDRYYKSNDKYRKSGFGTGLGLSIVKNILELHKFKYGVESEVGKGTTFYFNLSR